MPAVRAGGSPGRSLGLALALPLLALIVARLAFAQGGPVQYGYDELGRLTIVVDGGGNAAVYNYDSTGNVLSIQRLNAAEIPEPVAVYALSPTRGKVGSTVSILGKGFGATPGQNTVTFTGGAIATVTSATPTGLRVTVPPSAQTGPLTVNAPAGSATSPVSFRVIGPLTVTPTGAAIPAGGSRQFTVTGSDPTPAVSWTVNDVVSGHAGVGTISASGLYSAPAAVAQPFLATISASDRDDLTVRGTVTALIVPAGTQELTASAGVSVTFAPQAVTKSLQAAVSAAIAALPITKSLQNAVSTVIGGDPSAVVATQPVSATVGPVITAVSPAAGVRGATGLPVTLTGTGFTGATQVTFLRDNAPDSALTVALGAVSPDGTAVTLTLSIASGAPTGARVVKITTPSGASTVVGTSANLFTVQ